MLPWLALFLAVMVAHLAILRAMPARVGRLGLAAVLVSAVASHSAYALGVLYLWTRPEQVLQVIAVASLGMAMMHTQIARRHDDLTIFTDATAVAAGILAMAGWQTFQRGDPVGGLCFLGVFGLIYGYYLYGILDVARVRQRLDEAVSEAAHMEKTAAVGRLTGGVAHDFNNLLTAILGNLDLIAETDDREERREIVGEARAAATQAAQITAQLLAFSRQSRLNLGPVAPERTIAALRAILGRLLPATIELRLDIAAPLPPVSSDASRLQSVLLNLCINARDAMGGRGRLAIRARDRHVAARQVRRTDGWLAPGRYVAVSVVDSGPGIPEAIRERIFDPFFTTKSVGQGSGLGLSMAQGFLEQAGGAIGVDHPPEGGTCVTAWLPAADAAGER